jgi:hypothetical protein
MMRDQAAREKRLREQIRQQRREQKRQEKQQRRQFGAGGAATEPKTGR